MDSDHVKIGIAIGGVALFSVLLTYAVITSDAVYITERCGYDLEVIKVVPYHPEEATNFCYRESETQVQLVYDPNLEMTVPKTVIVFTTYGCQIKRLHCPR